EHVGFAHLLELASRAEDGELLGQRRRRADGQDQRQGEACERSHIAALAAGRALIAACQRPTWVSSSGGRSLISRPKSMPMKATMSAMVSRPAASHSLSAS